MKVSELSENLKPSAILQLAADIRALIAEGHQIYNLTIGDFNPKIFQIPDELKDEIIRAYESDNTNYPPGNGEVLLRKNISEYLKNNLGTDYSENEIMISGGARPLLYAAYQTLLDIGDTVLYPAPSWNNDAFTYLARNKAVILRTKAENRFLPMAEEIEPHIRDIHLISLCSPLNPTGTSFGKEELEKICDLILIENKRRNELAVKPLYLIYDQIYWQLSYGDTAHYHPVLLRPEMKDFTLSVDGISKCFAATGVRVGWAFGPKKIIGKMVSLLTHVGAWSPKAEQIAVGNYLTHTENVKSYMENIKSELSFRLNEFYKEFMQLKAEGFPVDAIQPEAALYLTLKFDLIGKESAKGQKINTVQDITNYLLHEAKVALVPFSSFGASSDSVWYRLSVGTTARNDIPNIMNNLKNALESMRVTV
ncbi:MAG: aminotransferase class I/II-fold pyridoxal phosphate-dependent enzyme [Weeksellaceae bacterium]